MGKTLLIINSHSVFGSVGKICEQTGQLAELDGWNVFIAAGRRHSQLSKLKTIYFDCTLSEYLHYIYSILFDAEGRGLASYFETRKLIREIKRIKPDVIHIHQIHGHYLNYPLLFNYLQKAKIHVVCTLHDYWYFTGGCTYCEDSECDKWLYGCNKCVRLREYPQSLILDCSSKNYELKKKYIAGVDNLHVVAVSKWLKSKVDSSFLKDKDVRYIYNGVDLDVFRYNPQSNLKLHRDAKYVLIAISNGWDKGKGLYDYYQLRTLLPTEYKIMLIGVIYGQEKTFPDGLLGIPRTNNVQELVDYYSEADIVLNLSYHETMGMTTVEGLACGKPSIVYDLTASPELVDEKTGVVVKAGDVEGVANAVRGICEGGYLLHSEDCRKRAESLFDKNKRYLEYIQLYNSIIENNNGNRS